MFRKQVSPRIAALAIVLILGAVQFFYWRLLVYRPVSHAQMGGGGGPMGPPIQFAVGLDSVQVEVFAGGGPGYVDGPGWRSRFCGPNALALERDGSLLVADSRNHRIRRVTRAGLVSTVAGGGPPAGPGGCAPGPALDARFRYPSGVSEAADGTIFVSDTGNHRLWRLRDGRVTLLAGGEAGMADGQGAQARFRSPAAMTVGPDGAVWVWDAGNGKVRRVSGDGAVTTPADVPAEARTALGASAAPPTPQKISAWTNSGGDAETTPFMMGRRSAALGATGRPLFYADTEHNSVLVQLPGQPAALVAGRRPEGAMFDLDSDGIGSRASFALPCATALAPDGTLYVAEYEGDRIRRLHLPDWLVQGSADMPDQRGGRWRSRGGS